MTEQSDQPSLPAGVSQREIAEEIGISVSTVSRVLTGHEHVSKRTVDDVRRAITVINDRRNGPIFPNMTDHLIGLTTSHVSQPSGVTQLDQITGQVLGGAESAAHRLGYRMYTTRDSRLLLDEANRSFLEGLSGLILAGGMISDEVVRSAKSAGIPLCIVGGHIPGNGIPSVASDSHHGMFLATQHLIQLGHSRIALINAPELTYTTHEKRAGYLRALSEADLPIDSELMRGHPDFGMFDTLPGLQTLNHFFALELPPTAIVFGTDELAAGAMTLMQRRGLRIPHDISIVGFQDDPVALTASPQLTTVHVDRLAWGERAVERLVAMSSGHPMEGDRLLLPVDLIVRDSTGPVRSGLTRKV